MVTLWASVCTIRFLHLVNDVVLADVPAVGLVDDQPNRHLDVFAFSHTR